MFTPCADDLPSLLCPQCSRLKFSGCKLSPATGRGSAHRGVRSDQECRVVHAFRSSPQTMTSGSWWIKASAPRSPSRAIQKHGLHSVPGSPMGVSPTCPQWRPAHESSAGAFKISSQRRYVLAFKSFSWSWLLEELKSFKQTCLL